jgi:hypothetical protein
MISLSFIKNLEQVPVEKVYQLFLEPALSEMQRLNDEVVDLWRRELR